MATGLGPLSSRTSFVIRFCTAVAVGPQKLPDATPAIAREASSAARWACAAFPPLPADCAAACTAADCCACCWVSEAPPVTLGEFRGETPANPPAPPRAVPGAACPACVPPAVPGNGAAPAPATGNPEATAAAI